MLVITRDNKNQQHTYIYDTRDAFPLVSFYRAQYRGLKLQGYQVKDASGAVVAYGGSI